jgi:predicted dehydrogenase
MGKESRGPLGIGVVGCGGIAWAHLEAIAKEPRVRLAAVADVDAARLERVADKFGAPARYGSWDALLEDAAVEAVILPLPHHLHEPAAIAALEAGRHVLVEKPIANTVAEADRMIAAAERARRVLMVGHMKRFNRSVVAMKRAVERGSIGEPFSFETVYYGPREIIPSIPWVMKKATGGGGPLVGFGTHHVDVLRWLFGEVREVACFTSRAVVEAAEVEDTAALALRFAGGVTGVIHFTWARSVEAFFEQFRVLGSRGEIVVRDCEAISMASEPRFGDRQFHELDLAEEAGDLGEHQFMAELAHFVECVRSGATPLTDAAGGRAAMAVIEAAYRSAESGTIITMGA